MRNGVALLATTLMACLVGCGPQKEPEAVAPPSGGGQASSARKTLKVAEVTDAGGIDDQSFNASAWEGLKRAAKEFGVEKKYLESKEISDYKTNLSTLADQGNDLIFAVGILMEDALKEVAPKYPKTRFAIIDGTAPDLLNCIALKFREEEGSFLAGYVAARMSKTGAIGFVGGMEIDLIKKFWAGYYAGARTANPNIRVIAKYVGNWTDVAKGKEIALEEFRQGADILFAAAGKGGLGVLDACNEKGTGFYGIGVDADQDHLHPGRILTSMMKGVDTVVYETIKHLKDGNWRSGEHVFGIKEGGIHLSPMKYTKQDVPADVLAKVETLSKQIAEGRLKVPKTEEELQGFLPPKI